MSKPYHEVLAEKREKAAQERARAEKWRRLINDLDRCSHGRHEGDQCSGSDCPGRSVGNPFQAMQPGKVIGFGYDGTLIVVPKEHRNDPDAWRSKSTLIMAASPSVEGCPNNPPCRHVNVVHDLDPSPRCCVDGCNCGAPVVLRRPDQGGNRRDQTRPADAHAARTQHPGQVARPVRRLAARNQAQG